MSARAVKSVGQLFGYNSATHPFESLDSALESVCVAVLKQ
jgi:hypothetical protein